MNEADFSFLIFISMILFMFTIGLTMFKKVKHEPKFKAAPQNDGAPAY